MVFLEGKSGRRQPRTPGGLERTRSPPRAGRYVQDVQDVQGQRPGTGGAWAWARTICRVRCRLLQHRSHSLQPGQDRPAAELTPPGGAQALREERPASGVPWRALDAARNGHAPPRSWRSPPAWEVFGDRRGPGRCAAEFAVEIEASASVEASRAQQRPGGNLLFSSWELSTGIPEPGPIKPPPEEGQDHPSTQRTGYPPVLALFLCPCGPLDGFQRFRG